MLYLLQICLNRNNSRYGIWHHECSVTFFFSKKSVVSHSMFVLFVSTIEMSKANNWQCLGNYTKKYNNVGQTLATSFGKKSHEVILKPYD